MSFSSSAEKQDITGTSELPTIMSESASMTPGGSAASRVLGIDELLLLIIEAIPKQHLSKLRRVSKKWNGIISSVGYAVKPNSHATSDEALPVPEGEPRYDLDVTIGINPAINSSAEATVIPSSLVIEINCRDGLAQAISKC